MIMNKNELKAKVQALNKTLEVSRIVQKELLAIFAEHVGCKICRIDGSLLRAVQAKIPEFKNFGSNVQVYKYYSNYTLQWVVKVCQQVEGECHSVYKELTVYVGDIQDGVFTKLAAPAELLEYFTVEQVEYLMEEKEKAEKALAEANSALHLFNF